MHSVIRPLAIGLGLLLASACARTSADQAAPAEPATATLERSASVTGIYLAPEIQRACDVTTANAFFEFDSAVIDHTDDASLKRVADCFTDGPLRGRKLLLVGHADPRGSEAHNFQLGKTRAEAVQVYLAGEGVELGDITTLTEGELEANPNVPAEWPFDRRVDIRLAAE
jgi:peptidoglycan-associated lipoprotein